jgi:hypothetical protein
MQLHLAEIFRAVIGLSSGVIIGLAFGSMQNAALRRYEKLQMNGKPDTGWAVISGSMRRVAFLLIALALVQIACPILFVGAGQWCVSAGVVGAYGWLLFSQLHKRKTAGR